MKYVIGVLIILGLILPCRADDFFIIGDKEGDAKILYPRQVQEGPDGNIYIYDERLAVIRFTCQAKFNPKFNPSSPGTGNSFFGFDESNPYGARFSSCSFVCLRGSQGYRR